MLIDLASTQLAHLRGPLIVYSPAPAKRAPMAMSASSRASGFVLAITLHNIPEGMAIGVGFSAGDMHVGVPLATAISIQDIPEGWMALDIGPASVICFNEVLADAKTIVWNGPVGAFEMDAFARGTMALAQSVAQRPKRPRPGFGPAIQQENGRENAFSRSPVLLLIHSPEN